MKKKRIFANVDDKRLIIASGAKRLICHFIKNSKSK